MGALIAIVWLIGTIASIWFIIRPSPLLPMYATRGRAVATGAAIFIGVPLISAIIGISGVPTSTLPKVAAATATGATNTTDGNSQAASAASASSWTYDESKDAMRGTTMKFAWTQSDEKSPNALGMSEQNTVLEVQKVAKGYEVEIGNPNLQFTCNSITDKQVSLKFDDGPIERFDCTGSAGDKFGIAYINPGTRIVSRLKTAKKLMIEAEVFQRGNIQMTFNVAGLTL